MRNNFKMMLLTMATLGLFSCSDKVTDNDTPSDGITDGFVVFSVNAVGNELRTARAGEAPDDEDFDSEYKDASDEYKVTTTAGANVVYFFDSSNNFVSQSNLLIMNGESDVTHPGHQTGDNDTYKEKYLKARIIKDADVNIKTGIVILNGDPTSLSGFNLAAGTSTLEDFMKKTQDLASDATENKLGRYGNLFTMSNTVYLGSDNKIQGPVDMKDKIFTTMEDAEANPIQVHVERVAAKFSMTFNKKDETTSSILANNIYTPEDKISVKSTSNGSATPKDWKLLINGWNVNGTETATYWVKHLYDGSNVSSEEDNSRQYNDGTMNPTTFGQWKATTESGDNEYGWNDNNRLRSYWAVDPHYNATDNSNAANYPQQYRTAEDGSIVSGINNSNDNVLHYIPYKNLNKTTSEATYAPENTFAYATTSDETWFKQGTSGYDYSDNAYMRTSTHILVAAQLLLGNELTDQSKIADKYCYENTYWTAEDTTELKKYMVEAMIAYGSFDLYTSDTDNSETSKFTLDNVNTYFDLYQPANIIGGDGRVKLTLKKSPTLYFAKTGDTNGIAVTDDDLADAINVVGTAQHYKEGKMYYYIPIKHMADIATNGDYKVGSYGVVRNHWYKVNVSAIKKPGVPVDNPDQPIVPNDDPDAGAYAAFEIVIIPWHVIDWDVTL